MPALNCKIQVGEHDCSDHIRVAAVPEPASVQGEQLLVKGAKNFELVFPSLGIDIPVKLSPVSGGQEFYKKPFVVSRDAPCGQGGNELRSMEVVRKYFEGDEESRSKLSRVLYPANFTLSKCADPTGGCVAGEGSRSKAWIRLKDIKSLKHLETTPASEFKFEGEVHTCKVVNDVEEEYKKPKKSDKMVISSLADADLANEYIYTDNVWEVIELDIKKKQPTAQFNLTRLAKHLHDTNQVGIAKNFVHWTGSDPAWAIISPIFYPQVPCGKLAPDECQKETTMCKLERWAGVEKPKKEETPDEFLKSCQETGKCDCNVTPTNTPNAFSVIARLVNRPFAPQRIAFPTEVVQAPKRVTQLGKIKE